METIKKYLWGIATILIIISGIYFSIKLKGLQFNIFKLFKSFKKSSDESISPFESLMMSSAAKVGVGSLAGIALAIYKGGVGTIFWIWVTSIISAPNAFAEGFLGSLYKRKKNSETEGGPAYYISKGMNKKKLGIVYALLVTFVYVICFSTIQSNTIATSIYEGYKIKNIYIGITMALIVAILISGNTKSLFKIISKMVPIMGIGYLFLGLFVIIKNYYQIPYFFLNIIKEALNFKSASVGFLTAFIIGIQRGIFSNEAGIGTGAIASASASTSPPQAQGQIQILGTYFISLIICTITSFIIITSPYKNLKLDNINGIEITQYSLKYHFGSFGEIALILSIFFFALSTIIAGYYYGKSNLDFIFNGISRKTETLFKLLTIILIMFGSIVKADLIWDLSDIFIAILAIINIYSLLSLKKDIITNLKT